MRRAAAAALLLAAGGCGDSRPTPTATAPAPVGGAPVRTAGLALADDAAASADLVRLDARVRGGRTVARLLFATPPRDAFVTVTFGARQVGFRLDDRGVVRRASGPVRRRGVRVEVGGPAAREVGATVFTNAALAQGAAPDALTARVRTR